MKKIFAVLLALSMIAVLAVSVSAAAIDHLPSEVAMYSYRVDKPVKVDGILDDCYGEPLWSFSGQDAWDVDALGGAQADYQWNLWPDGYEQNESADAAKKTRFSGYSCWDDKYIYMFIQIDMGDNPFYFNPICEWQGNCLQMNFCPVKGWVDQESRLSWMFSLADAVTPITTSSRGGEWNYKTDSLNYRVLYDGQSIANYEFAMELEKFEMEPVAGNEFYFAMSCNINVADDLNTNDFNGYQVGTGVFNGKGTLGDSHILTTAIRGEEQPAEEPAIEDAPAEEPAETTDTPEVTEEVPEATKPVVAPAKPAKTADVSALMAVLAAISAVGGAVVLKRK